MSAETYLGAAEAFADLVDRLPVDLSGPGLGEWDLRALVGHTSRSLVTVIDYLQQPADSVVAATAADYYVEVGRVSLEPAAIVERGVQAGAALGDDPAAAVRRLVETVADALVGADADAVITTIVGGMRLRDYLPTRVFELAVHGLDIANATGLDWQPPRAALAEALALAGEVAVAAGTGPAALLALTGRGEAISVV
ncbi:maleylpyruvate isomerase N-terminal domain-containing protein [Nocardioides sp. SYSU D00038]|uniref:maleylpyruvate isomerase N-terminal domain-containing protein n=1 Tax=Nocardioides sp. SYSU D00038 TaxID=2812554 RepID=UPI0019687A9A|nr:maleylpyruvate isomerase N-terminal domain-containing protein [Nocardioides sp. SYSU D00038]